MSDLRDGSDRNVLYWKALRDTLGRMRQAEGEAPASPGAGTLPPDDGGREEGLKELRSLRVRLEEALEEQTSLMERLDCMPSDGVLLDGLVQATHYMLERQTEANEGLGKYLGELESLRGSAAPQAPAGAADGAGTRQEGEPRASGAAEESTAGGSAAEADPESGPQGQSGPSWRAAAGDIVAGRYDTDRDKLLDVLEAAIAGADRENVPDAERGPLKAAQEHFTDLLARVSSDTGTEKSQPLREAAESEAPAASEASDARETGENAPVQESPGEERAEDAPKRIPVTRGDGGEQAVPLRRVSAHDEPGTASLPDWMADIVGIAAGRFDTGSSLADVQTQSELLRRAIDRARQEGREQDFRPWFDQTSAHINALLRGAAAVEGPGRGDRDEPEYMRLVDRVNDGSYDNRVEDIFPIINVALQEARRQGRDGEYRSRIQQAADRLSKLLGGFGSEAGSRPQSGEGTPEPEKTEPVQESAAQAGESADAGGEDAGEEELPPYMQEVKKVLDGFYDEDPAEAQSIVRSAAMSAAEDGRSEEFEDMLGAASDRVDTLLGGRDERQPASEGELPPYMQAVQGVLEGAYDSDPRAMLAIVRRAAQLAEQEGRLEEYGDMISAASARGTGIMRQGQADGAENPVDVTDGDGRALPSYMEAVQDVLRGRYDNDPGAVLVIVRRAAEQAAREGRQEEFADMLQAASDRFAMLMHRSGPGRRVFGQPDWLTALQDVVRGAYDDDPARMESLVRWAADRAAEEGQMGRVRGLIEEAARRVRAVSRRNGSFWDAF